MKRIVVLGLIALSSLLLFSLTLTAVHTPVEAQNTPRDLFTTANAVTRDAVLPLPGAELPRFVGSQRSRVVSLDAEALALLSRDAASVSLNLFEDVRLNASILRRDSRGIGTSSEVWTGELTGVPYSNVVLLIAPSGDTSLQVLLPGRNYTVQPIDGGLYRISEIDTYVQRGYDDAVVIEPNTLQAAQVLDRVNSPREDSGDVIDVMVVYTPKAASFFGGQSFMELAIENTVALTNKTYENSGVSFRVRLVHTAQVDYNEQVFRDLDRLSDPSDGYMDEVHALRDQYAADLVALIPGNSAEIRGYCGIAFLPTSLPAPNAAFSVTEALCISDITFAHELGHTMGKAHDRANAGSAVHPYAYGYQDLANPPGADWGDFVTVMAYSDGGECPPIFQPGVCPAIAWWSNPNQTFNGKPLGTADENNALSLNQTAQLIANYRVSADGSPTATPSRTTTAVPPTEVEPTPTTQPVQQWVLNGSFDIDADKDRIPDGWKAVNARQICDDQNCYGALKAKPGSKAILKQVISIPAPVSGKITVSAMLGAMKTPTPGKILIIAKVLDTEGKPQKLVFRFKAKIVPALDALQRITTPPQPLPGMLYKVKVLAKYSRTDGKTIVDDIQVITLP
jgi:peptidyl-Asp metalloendopeptidase